MRRSSTRLIRPINFIMGIKVGECAQSLNLVLLFQLLFRRVFELFAQRSLQFCDGALARTLSLAALDVVNPGDAHAGFAREFGHRDATRLARLRQPSAHDGWTVNDRIAAAVTRNAAAQDGLELCNASIIRYDSLRFPIPNCPLTNAEFAGQFALGQAASSTAEAYPSAEILVGPRSVRRCPDA